MMYKTYTLGEFRLAFFAKFAENVVNFFCHILAHVSDGLGFRIKQQIAFGCVNWHFNCGLKYRNEWKQKQ